MWYLFFKLICFGLLTSIVVPKAGGNYAGTVRSEGSWSSHGGQSFVVDNGFGQSVGVGLCEFEIRGGAIASLQLRREASKLSPSAGKL